MTNTRREEVRSWVQDLGMRWTAARAVVLDTLLTHPEHLSVLELHELVGWRLPDRQLSTIHRTVNALTDLGVLHTLGLPGEARYGMADLPHHHAVCTHCGCVWELPANAIKVRAATVLTQFDIAPTGLTVAGSCVACRTTPHWSDLRAEHSSAG